MVLGENLIGEGAKGLKKEKGNKFGKGVKLGNWKSIVAAKNPVSHSSLANLQVFVWNIYIALNSYFIPLLVCFPRSFF